ncbi:MAG TPA: acyltransferase [Flavipsychrobacter sp.]
MIKPLASLRFFFSILVFTSHLWFLENDSPAIAYLHKNLFKEGFIGVSFFFILSGFIMSYGYGAKLQSDKISFTSFWVGRFARVYPVHLLTLLLAIPLSINTDVVTWINKFLLNALLMQSFVPSDGYYLTFNAVSWSISTEFFFYLCFPMLALLLTRRKVRMFVVPAYVIIVSVGLLLTKDALHHAVFYVNPLMRAGDFLIGMLLYNLYAKRKDVEYLNNRRFANFAEVVTIAMMVGFMYFHNHVPMGFRYSMYYLLPMSMLVYVFSYSKGFISDLISRQIFVYLGGVSFVFYMLHVLVIRYYTLLQSKIPALPINYVAAIILYFVTMLIAVLLHRYYEMPANSFIKKTYANRTILNIFQKAKNGLKKA